MAGDMVPCVVFVVGYAHLLLLSVLLVMFVCLCIFVIGYAHLLVLSMLLVMFICLCCPCYW